MGADEALKATTEALDAAVASGDADAEKDRVAKQVLEQPQGRKLLQSDDIATLDAGTALSCTSVAHAKCKEVTGPKSLCEGDSGGELIQKADETICSFKDCKTPSNWANQMGGQIEQDAWCYV